MSYYTEVIGRFRLGILGAFLFVSSKLESNSRTIIIMDIQHVYNPVVDII